MNHYATSSTTDAILHFHSSRVTRAAAAAANWLRVDLALLSSYFAQTISNNRIAAFGCKFISVLKQTKCLPHLTNAIDQSSRSTRIYLISLLEVCVSTSRNQFALCFDCTHYLERRDCRCKSQAITRFRISRNGRRALCFVSNALTSISLFSDSSIQNRRRKHGWTQKILSAVTASTNLMLLMSTTMSTHSITSLLPQQLYLLEYVDYAMHDWMPIHYTGWIGPSVSVRPSINMKNITHTVRHFTFSKQQQKSGCTVFRLLR